MVLTETHPYCANEGTAMTPEDADPILRMGSPASAAGGSDGSESG